MESNEAYFLYGHVQGNECANSRRPGFIGFMS
jgi:hypothetical protein